MRTIELTIYLEDELQEFLIADLLDRGFDGFKQGDQWVKAYIAAPRWSDVKREHLEQWLRNHGITAPLEEQVVEDKNWNDQWEKTVQPVAVGAFLVKPTWAEVPPADADRVVLEIDPKMSFGTGYHETTRLMLRFLPDLVQEGDRVLDAGTGTGILAIAAVKLGATSALAFDTDEWAQQNAVENVYLNRVTEQVDFRAGSLEVVPESDFDFVLANINRNVLLDMLPAFAEKARPGGRIALAGLLHADRADMLRAAADNNLTLSDEAREGEWWAVVLKKGEKERERVGA